MISVVIRNKNEASYLKRILPILTKLYADDIDEIVVVDNNSTDDSIEVSLKYNCKIVSIDYFTYGRAINIGIKATKNEYVLLLSSHAIPIGRSFFKNTMNFIQDKKDFAGLRYINSIENYERALANDFIVKEPLNFGLMAACCIISKAVFNLHLFNEDLVFSEDKEWSQRVGNAGYSIYEIDETFFYFIERNKKSVINRFKNETISECQLQGKKFSSKMNIIASFLKKIIITNTKNYFSTLLNDIIILKTKFEIIKKLKNNG